MRTMYAALKTSSVSHFRLALLFGGRSHENSISLASARTLCDLLESHEVEVILIYFDQSHNPHLLTRSQLYSNTTEDFDFKINQISKKLSQNDFQEIIYKTDLCIPLIHGPFGEDGTVQKILEDLDAPFLGSSSEVCKIVFNKYSTSRDFEKLGFNIVPTTVVLARWKNWREIVREHFSSHCSESVIIKPVSGGSSIGVSVADSYEEAICVIEKTFNEVSSEIIIQEKIIGSEFSVVVIENKFSQAVALLPTEIELSNKSHRGVFTEKAKYLITENVKYYCPPRLSDEEIDQIQILSEQLYAAYSMRDFARLDGFVCPDGQIIFTDINPISGFEQRSILFHQASYVGLNHFEILSHLLDSACRRYGIDLEKHMSKSAKGEKRSIPILFGGDSSERNQSLLSGMNVWMQLQNSLEYKPKPIFIDESQNAWEVPYYAMLSRNTEEVEEICLSSLNYPELLDKQINRIRQRLCFSSKSLKQGKRTSYKQVVEDNSVIFNALHGGFGEDGGAQSFFEKHGVCYNGANSEVSSLCMDKAATSEALSDLYLQGLKELPQRLLQLNTIGESATVSDFEFLWSEMCKDFSVNRIIAKPNDSGSSCGVVCLSSGKELFLYVQQLNRNAQYVFPKDFKEIHENVRLPEVTPQKILLEPFITTDKIFYSEGQLQLEHISGWLEVTIGILEFENKLRALTPSVTLSSGNILSEAEKFQSGNGVNFTPPPRELVPETSTQRAKKQALLVAQNLNIEGYARIDAFMNVSDGSLMVIEVNTLPALMSATVFYQQALRENPALYPIEVIETIIAASINRSIEQDLPKEVTQGV